MRFWDVLSHRYKPITRHVRTIMVMNSKGGCGKTTVATNLASYYAERGRAVVLADFDPQGSSLAWLAARDGERAPITGLAAWRDPLWIPRETEFVIMDVPAGVPTRRMRSLIRHAQTVLVPVLPSAIDIRAAEDFIERLMHVEKIAHLQTKVGFVGNRVRESARAFTSLSDFFERAGIPVVAQLRDSQNYTTAAERGLGIHELSNASVLADLDQWAPLVKWLKGRASQPRAR